MKLSWRQCHITHTHTLANNLVWIITATVCLNDFYTHFNGSLWCDNTNSLPVKGRWRKSGNYFSIRVSVNPLPHLAPLLTGNDWATTSTILPSVLYGAMHLISKKLVDVLISLFCYSVQNLLLFFRVVVDCCCCFFSCYIFFFGSRQIMCWL